jgi:hypothetical protein
MENDTQTNSLPSFWRSQPKTVILAQPLKKSSFWRSQHKADILA